MKHAQRLSRRADCEGPTRRYSGALLLLAIASVVIACADSPPSWNSPFTTTSNTSNTATLVWDAVTAPGLSGYRIYYGTVSGAYGQGLSVGNTVSYQIMGLSNQTTYYFTVTAYDSQGYESPYSNEVSKTIP